MKERKKEKEKERKVYKRHNGKKRIEMEKNSIDRRNTWNLGNRR